MSRASDARAAQGYKKTTEQRCGCCTWLRWDERVNRRGRVVRGDYRCGLGGFSTGLWGWCEEKPDDGAENTLAVRQSDDGAENGKPRRGGA